MDDFTRKFITEWRKLQLPFAEESFVVAVSGGADSTALTLALKELKERGKLKLRFIVAHLNHGFRKESSEDEKFVEQLASLCGFGFVSQRVDLSRIKSDLEQKARQIRYKFLEDIARKEKAFGVLTAHTMNDQAETFLINLIRGSGIRGLSAMKPLREISKQADTLLIRPLLRWAKRSDTEDFCAKNNIEFRTDWMNKDKKFTRARVRYELIPFLENFNPKIIEVLSRTANLISEENEALEELIKRTFDAEIKISELKKMSPGVRHRVLRSWLESEIGELKGINAVHIEAIERLVLSKKSGRFAELPTNLIIRKRHGKLYLTKKDQKPIES
ncbi:MAG: tRNA lysidine(34) synthetase TilS [Pyrinomonadaceae bacterium]|nr:tRNA lysidine(34) synthetase TilS [Pyrinomonadaceae bacterium]MCX7639102.1 tRNA lysidine(34) synthetase TilS [Pyrinomonadaceae bacterium]MDW8303677.1 tRNA lysidine(34) synthetase TilS [Acidobacteriota bacterium]